MTDNQILKTDISNNLSFGHTVLSVINLTFPCKATVANVFGPKFYLILIKRDFWNVCDIISLDFHQIRFYFL